MYMAPPDEGDDSVEHKHSPGGIVIESLLNVRTIASLTMEDMKLEEYSEALCEEEAYPWRTNCIKGSGAGLGQFFQVSTRKEYDEAVRHALPISNMIFLLSRRK